MVPLWKPVQAILHQIEHFLGRVRIAWFPWAWLVKLVLESRPHPVTIKFIAGLIKYPTQVNQHGHDCNGGKSNYTPPMPEYACRPGCPAARSAHSEDTPSGPPGGKFRSRHAGRLLQVPCTT
eukprot:7851247-Pyramimonas_sp.AAC.1